MNSPNTQFRYKETFTRKIAKNKKIMINECFNGSYNGLKIY